MKPLKRFGEAFYPYVVQGGFGTVSAVASVGGRTILFSLINVVCHIVSGERVSIIFLTSVPWEQRSLLLKHGYHPV